MDAASNTNENQESSWGINASGPWGWQTYNIYMQAENPWSLNLLKPLGPVQACNGIALHLLYITDLISINNKPTDFYSYEQSAAS